MKLESKPDEAKDKGDSKDAKPIAMDLTEAEEEAEEEDEPAIDPTADETRPSAVRQGIACLELLLDNSQDPRVQSYFESCVLPLVTSSGLLKTIAVCHLHSADSTL